MDYPFYAMLSRMRYITRWSLMRNTFSENIQEHSHQVAVLAHALALIRRDVLGLDADPERCATAALFHDASEILTGDLPTPIKYYDTGIRDAYRAVERTSCEKLLSMLPPALQDGVRAPLFESDETVRPIVKAADKLSAHIKCIEELKAGNPRRATWSSRPPPARPKRPWRKCACRSSTGSWKTVWAPSAGISTSWKRCKREKTSCHTFGSSFFYVPFPASGRWGQALQSPLQPMHLPFFLRRRIHAMLPATQAARRASTAQSSQVTARSPAADRRRRPRSRPQPSGQSQRPGRGARSPAPGAPPRPRRRRGYRAG